VNVNDKIKNKRCKRKKIGLMEWLKVKVLSSSPSTVKGKKKRSRELFAPVSFEL
jgi:hypothetical protein